MVLEHGDFDTCVSRCYYAMYYLAEAVLQTEEIKTSSHKGVISSFGQYFIKTGVFDRELGKALNEAYDKRLYGDYSIGFAITKSKAKKQLKVAKEFVAELKEYLERKLK